MAGLRFRKARLLLCVDSDVYAVLRLTPDPSVAKVAWRLCKIGSDTTYDVAFGEWPSCECGAAVYRNEACKHVRACQAVGLLPKE